MSTYVIRSSLFCLFGFLPFIPVNIVTLCLDGSKLRIQCLAQRHNTVPPVRLELTTHQSLVNHSTICDSASHIIHVKYIHVKRNKYLPEDCHTRNVLPIVCPCMLYKGCIFCSLLQINAREYLVYGRNLHHHLCQKDSKLLWYLRCLQILSECHSPVQLQDNEISALHKTDIRARGYKLVYAQLS